ncbi:MAG: hypothetical protein ACD_58C00220G0002 [uncultured bacterium]|nr:MAG: hypothetical protein ACD_58C00220G0002 [uncultured bacterium]
MLKREGFFDCSIYLWYYFDMKTKTLPFKIFLEYDPEYKGYVADCVSLPGCMSQGKTENEALENIAEAIRGYLKSLRTHLLQLL